MKTLPLLSLVMFCSFTSRCQPSEFTIHDNGLIYDETTMSKLGHIVDSLNLRFKTCDVKQYTSLPQGHATIVSLGTDVKKAKQALRGNISVQEFVKMFPGAVIKKKEWVIKSSYVNYKNEKILHYLTLPLRKREERNLYLPDQPANDKISGWIFREDEGDLLAFYLEELKAPELPFGYARLVQYVDCMIDTTAQIYLTKRSSYRVELAPNLAYRQAGPKISQFLSVANDFAGKPEPPSVEWSSPFAEAAYNKYNREYQQWDNKRLESLDQKMKKGAYYISLLMEAADEAVAGRIGDAELEFYIEKYLSPAQALEMKRNRKPVGMCSQDRTPRTHAASICRLAAETAKWDIFLRAHLDIMNDNFSRMSDGSYAWAGRGTYLKELEELDINALDLLLGTCLRAGNVNDNHYLGDIGRIGRALAETSHANVLENRLLVMIQDEELDIFNRLLIAYVFDNYNHHVKDQERKEMNVVNFKKAVATLPMGIGETF